jgi:hypothetical protein
MNERKGYIFNMRRLESSFKPDAPKLVEQIEQGR